MQRYRDAVTLLATDDDCVSVSQEAYDSSVPSTPSPSPTSSEGDERKYGLAGQCVLGGLPYDAMGVVFSFLPPEALVLLSATSRAFRYELRYSRSDLWVWHCTRELGYEFAPCARTFCRTAMLEGEWEGSLAVARPDVVREVYPELPLYDSVVNIAVSLTIPPGPPSRRVPLEGHVRFLRPRKMVGSTATNDLEFAYMHCVGAMAGEHNAYFSVSVTGASWREGGRMKFRFSDDRGVVYEGQTTGRKALLGTFSGGSFCMLLREAERYYDSLRTGSQWVGNSITSEGTALPMSMRLDGVSSGCGITHGVIERPTLSNATRAAGVFGVIDGISSREVFKRPLSWAKQAPPEQSDSHSAPPLCTLMSATPIRWQHHRSTRFIFCEYQWLQRGESVVPIHYTSEVAGDIIAGTYRVHEPMGDVAGAFVLELV